MENHEKIEENTSTLPQLTIWQHTAELPIIQGGMGIGISMAELAGNVSLHWGIGTLSAAAIHMTAKYREYWTNLIKEAKQNSPDNKLSKEESRLLFKQANVFCLQEEIKHAKTISQEKPVFVNIMVASKDYDDLVIAACEAGVDGIVSGAGFPRHLPSLTKEYPNVALLPIFSTLRQVKSIVNHWKDVYGRLPDAIILEDPTKTWGHLGKWNLEAVFEEDGSLAVSIPQVIEYLKSQGRDIPVIAAWWINNRNDIDTALGFWANAVQMWTRFLATEESNANKEFKDAIISATKEDIKVVRSSVWLPFRALVMSGTFTREWGPKDRIAQEKECSRECLIHCWFVKGIEKVTQMCILKELLRSTEWGKWSWLLSTGDFFDKEGNPKITSILPVKEIMEILKK